MASNFALQNRVPLAPGSLPRYLIGVSNAARELRHNIRLAAHNSASVLITGPSGSGKEVVATAIHHRSARAHAPFIPVNCGAITPELIESELFGHEKGSFTGATGLHKGCFELADKGTIFLDEIGDMQPDMQVRLLRVLEDARIRRVGGEREIPIDLRVIAATHRDIRDAIGEKRFREDLYYRLSVLVIEVPPLSERREDVAPLVDYFLERLGDAHAKPDFSPGAIRRMEEYDWPGNVRELRNVVERASVRFPGERLDSEHVAELIRSDGAVGLAPATPSANGHGAAASLPDASRAPVDLKAYLLSEEKRLIEEALRLTKGVVAQAARQLRLGRTTFAEKMKRHRIDSDAWRS